MNVTVHLMLSPFSGMLLETPSWKILVNFQLKTSFIQFEQVWSNLDEFCQVQSYGKYITYNLLTFSTLLLPNTCHLCLKTLFGPINRFRTSYGLEHDIVKD